MEVKDLYTEWSSNEYFDQDVREELKALEGNDAEIRERFYRNLAFGTAGIRGILGAGTNRMNKYVIRRASYGIAQMLKEKGEEACKRGIVIAYDSRLCSDVFAKEAASVYAGNGIKVYLHKSICPVPILSFSVRYLKTISGAMVTASHNPKEYNGYKVYGEDGCQLPTPETEKIIELLGQYDDYTKVPSYDFDALVSEGKIEYVGDEIYRAYYESAKSYLADPETLKETAGKINLVYTPLHGTGARFVPELLKQIGFTNVYTVEEQMQPDGHFPTVNVPNPEFLDVYDLAIKIANKNNADVILASDPDADRTGVAVKDKDGNFKVLTGNQIGILLLNYILKGKKNAGTLKDTDFVVSTIVSSRLTAEMCKAYNVGYADVLTGFKYIGEQITNREENGNEKFILGFEESYGYLIGSFARDKDSVSACMLLAEEAAYYNSKGMTLLDALNEIFDEFGYWLESQNSFTFPGEAGSKKISDMMSDFREKKADVLPGEIIKFTDYNYGPEVTGVPKSNVLYYEVKDGWFCVRPSGTEPKIKLYCGAKGKCINCATKRLDEIRSKALEFMK